MIHYKTDTHWNAHNYLVYLQAYQMNPLIEIPLLPFFRLDMTQYTLKQSLYANPFADYVPNPKYSSHLHLIAVHQHTE